MLGGTTVSVGLNGVLGAECCALVCEEKVSRIFCAVSSCCWRQIASYGRRRRLSPQVGFLLDERLEVLLIEAVEHAVGFEEAVGGALSNHVLCGYRIERMAVPPADR